jgi:hypothetical protein
MKSMVWHPEERDEKINLYLQQSNHAPYILIWASLLSIFCVFTFTVLMGVF